MERSNRKGVRMILQRTSSAHRRPRKALKGNLCMAFYVPIYSGTDGFKFRDGESSEPGCGLLFILVIVSGFWGV